MRNFKKVIALSGLLVALLSPSPGFSQATLTETTLAVAATQTANVLTVTSATGFTANYLMYVDRELMKIVSVSSTSITVTRGVGGIQTAHAILAPVAMGPAEYFIASDRFGTCTSATVYPPVLPQINTSNGKVFNCQNSKWINIRTNLSTLPKFISGLGATATLTTEQCGSTIILDRAAGIVFTMPAPVVGCEYKFIVTTSVTSNAYKWSTATQGTDWFRGPLISDDTDSSDALVGFPCNGTSHDNISMNGSTTGGLVGTTLTITGESSILWHVTGVVNGSGSVATSCATS